MKSIALAVIKVIAGVIATQLLLLSAAFALGTGAESYFSSQCATDTGTLCGLAATVRAWWFMTAVVVAFPVLIVSFVFFVRRWSAPSSPGASTGEAHELR